MILLHCKSYGYVLACMRARLRFVRVRVHVCVHRHVFVDARVLLPLTVFVSLIKALVIGDRERSRGIKKV